VQLYNTADAYRPLYAHLMDVTKVNTEHILLTEAMANRDVERAVLLNYEHRAHSIDNLTEALMQEQAELTS